MVQCVAADCKHNNDADECIKLKNQISLPSTETVWSVFFYYGRNNIAI